MRIGIDIDGIMNNIIKYQLKYATPFFREKYGKEVVNQNSLDIKEIFDLTKEEEYMFKEFWGPFSVKIEPLINDMAKNIPLRHGIKELFEQIEEKGYVPYIVTERYATDRNSLWGKYQRKLVKSYFKANGINIKKDNFVFCSEGSKLDAYKRLGLELAIEDNVNNLESLNEAGIVTISIVAEHNKNYKHEMDYKVTVPHEIPMIIEKAEKAIKEVKIKEAIKRKGQFEPITGYASIDQVYRKYYSDEEEKIKIPHMKLFDYLEASSKEMGFTNSAIAEYYGVELTIKEFKEKIYNAAKAFRGSGIQEGDYVLIAIPNTLELLYSLYALNIIGAIPMMANSQSSVEEVETYLNVKPKVAIIFNRSYPKWEKVLKNSKVENIISVSVDSSMEGLIAKGYKITQGKNDPKISIESGVKTWNEFVEQNKNKKFEGNLKSEFKENSCALIIMTGGTTGPEKFAMISNENCNYIAEAFKILINNTNPNSKTLNAMPYFHVFGLIQIFHYAASSGKLNIILPNPKLNDKEMIKLFKKYYPIVNQNSVPAFTDKVFNAIENTKYENLVDGMEYNIVGGDATGEKRKARGDGIYTRVGARARVKNAYGITEGSGGVFYTIIGDDIDGNIGVPIPGTIAKIVKKGTTEELKYGEEGELVFSGPSVFLGYLNNEEENKKALQIHDDGKKWLHTGDLAVSNPDGTFTFVGREKRIIVVNGENIYPNRIENKIVGKHPAIEGFYILKEKHPTRGEAPIAKIKLKEGFVPSVELKEQIMDVIKATFSKKQYWPVSIDFINQVPMTKKSTPDYNELEKKEYIIDVTSSKPVTNINVLQERYAGNRVYRISRSIYNTVSRYTKEISVVGKENIPETGPVVINMPHTHKNDQLSLMGAIDRIVTLYAKKEYFETPIIGAYYKKLEMISVDRYGDAEFAKGWGIELIDSLSLSDFEKQQPIIEDIIGFIQSLMTKEYSKPADIKKEILRYLTTLTKEPELIGEAINYLSKMPISGKENNYGRAFKSNEQAGKILEAGRVFALFAERTRNENFYKTGKFLPMSDSPVWLARNYDAPLVVTDITGDHDRYRGKILVRSGKPIYVDSNASKNTIKEISMYSQEYLYNLKIENLLNMSGKKYSEVLSIIANNPQYKLTDENKEALGLYQEKQNTKQKILTIN